MSSKDVLGYPPRHFYRKALEAVWESAFGSLDIGDFETFLKESADRTYVDALDQIESRRTNEKPEPQQIREGKELQESGGIEQYKTIAQELKDSGDEYTSSAIESLIAELIAERNKPKKKPVARKQKQAILPPIPKEGHGEDYAWLQNAITNSSLDELEVAEHDLHKPGTHLTPSDRDELSQLIYRKRQAAKKILSPDELSAHVLRDEKINQQIPAKRDNLALDNELRDRRRKREEELERGYVPPAGRRPAESRKEEDEDFPEFRPVVHELPKLNVRNAIVFLKTYKKYIPEMITIGFVAWIEKHPEAEKFPITTESIRMIGSVLDRFRTPLDPLTKPSGREKQAENFLIESLHIALMHGIDEAAEGYDWDRYYSMFKSEVESLDKFRDIVIQTVPRVIQRLYRP